MTTQEIALLVVGYALGFVVLVWVRRLVLGVRE